LIANKCCIVDANFCILPKLNVVCLSYANVQQQRGLLMQRHIGNGDILLSTFNN